MLTIKRWEEIVRILERDGSVDVNSLSDRFGVTAKTIRQDLAELESRGLLKRVHGGAVYKSNGGIFPIRERKQHNLQEKERIAKAALKYIEDGDTVILDGGSTTLQLAKQLGETKLVVITNDLIIAGELLSREAITLYLSGGRLRREGVYTLLGREAERTIIRYHANKLFLGTSALDFEQGLTVFLEEEAEIKKAMISAAKEIICLADYNKFHKTALVSFAPLQKINRLITDDRIPETDLKYLKGRGIEVEVV
ncbi:MAG: DeoR/GlpR transcriptional regulator [Firmicutes bacterium]|nr:DeoR/GlpR transcriptional regulator [Bacillota bacterium]